jgi:hypothetical protein
MQYEAIMTISLALVDKCDAILMIGESAGANRERDLVKEKGLPVYTYISEIPLGSASNSARRCCTKDEEAS